MTSHLSRLFGTLAIMAACGPMAAFADEGSVGLQAGGAASITPKYEGSKDYKIRGFPIVAPASSGSADAGEPGPVQFRGIDDIRFRVLRFGGLEVGPLAGYRFGRQEGDSDTLTGLGDVDGGLVVGGYAAYDLGALKPFVSYHHQVTGDTSGAVLRFGAETRIPLASGLALTAVAGATYADEDYMDAYFSVSNAQSAKSGLAAYDAGAGIKDVYASLGTDLMLTDRLSLKLGAKYSLFQGDAVDSPVVETDHQLSGVVGLTYSFSVDR
jgi:MipA family protein